jgi:hypothetical protein
MRTADFGFKGDYGVYHSVYDSFHWMDKCVKGRRPGRAHVALASPDKMAPTSRSH